MRSTLLCLVLALGALGCTRHVDPGYLSAVQARADAICACKAKDGLDCVQQMADRYPIAPPNGESVEDYEARLDEAERKPLEEAHRKAGACTMILREATRVGGAAGH